MMVVRFRSLILFWMNGIDPAEDLLEVANFARFQENSNLLKLIGEDVFFLLSLKTCHKIQNFLYCKEIMDVFATRRTLEVLLRWELFTLLVVELLALLEERTDMLDAGRLNTGIERPSSFSNLSRLLLRTGLLSEMNERVSKQFLFLSLLSVRVMS